MPQITIRPYDTDPDQPHVLVYYDESYLAVGNADYDPHIWYQESKSVRSGYLKPSCQRFYIPWKLIELFSSLHAAFVYLTKKADIHFADYDADSLYRADGTPWPEDDLERFSGIAALKGYLSQ